MGIAKKVENIVLPIITQMGYDLIEVEYRKEGPQWYLRLYVDKMGGITIDDCQEVSMGVSDAIDEADLIKDPYIFEVCSPGIDRPLVTDRDFERYKGQYVQIDLISPKDDETVYNGDLVMGNSEKVVISDSNGNIIEFERSDIAVVKRAISW